MNALQEPSNSAMIGKVNGGRAFYHDPVTCMKIDLPSNRGVCGVCFLVQLTAQHLSPSLKLALHRKGIIASKPLRLSPQKLPYKTQRTMSRYRFASFVVAYFLSLWVLTTCHSQQTLPKRSNPHDETPDHHIRRLRTYPNRTIAPTTTGRPLVIAPPVTPPTSRKLPRAPRSTLRRSMARPTDCAKSVRICRKVRHDGKRLSATM